MSKSILSTVLRHLADLIDPPVPHHYSLPPRGIPVLDAVQRYRVVTDRGGILLSAQHERPYSIEYDSQGNIQEITGDKNAAVQRLLDMLEAGAVAHA